LLPKEKVIWKFSPTENRFGFSKDFILFWSESYLEIYTGISFGTYMHNVTHVRYSEIFQLWDSIDLIIVMWVYNDKLQIKFTLRSGPVIF
jgi:hypothetical protein